MGKAGAWYMGVSVYYNGGLFIMTYKDPHERCPTMRKHGIPHNNMGLNKNGKDANWVKELCLNCKRKECVYENIGRA